MENKKYNILVADDEQTDRELCLDILGDIYQIDLAEDGERAWEKLNKKKYDVLLTDFNMPGMDGLALLNKIKESKMPVEVLMMTAYATIDNAVVAMKLGAYDYITKPANVDKLTILVEKAIEKRELTRKLKESNNTLVQAEKMAVLGELSGSLAHQLRNPLYIMLASAQYCLEKINDPDIKENLEIIVKNGQNAEEIIQKLLDFSKPIPGEIQDTDFKKLVLKVTDLIKVKCRLQNVNLTVKTDESIGNLKIDSYHLEQAILNLTINSLDAMPDGGDLAIFIDDDGINIVIKIDDSGKGIAPDEIKNIFTPFFTTKRRGTGLGLSIVKRIIEEHNGEIEFKGRNPQGTSVVIRIPKK